MGFFAATESAVGTSAKPSDNSKHYIHDDTAITSYLREIGGNRILSRAEEKELFVRIARGDKRAFNELITANLKFVVSVCRTFQNQGLPMADLISEGNLGLIRAARGFDSSHSCRFISYAVWWIRQRILRALAEQTRFLTIPVGKAAAIRKIAQAERVIQQKKSRPPSADELAGFLSIKEKDVLELLQIGQHSLGLHDTSSSEEEGNVGDTLEDPSGENPERKCMSHRLKREVGEALDALQEPAREVLRLHFGIGAGRPMNMEEIAGMLGMSRARVRKIKDDALDRLRHPVRKIKFEDIY